MEVAPEASPPSPKPRPKPVVNLEGASYYLELANRVEKWIPTHVLGEQAKREIGYAVEVLRQLGGSNADLPH